MVNRKSPSNRVRWHLMSRSGVGDLGDHGQELLVLHASQQRHQGQFGPLSDRYGRKPIR
jgi:hypothetical protein